MSAQQCSDVPHPFDSEAGPLVEWESLLLAPMDDVEFAMTDAERIAHREQLVAELDAEREASLKYARDYGYDVDPVTGQYLPPNGA